MNYKQFDTSFYLINYYFLFNVANLPFHFRLKNNNISLLVIFPPMRNFIQITSFEVYGSVSQPFFTLRFKS